MHEPSRKPAVFFLVRMRIMEGGGGKEGKTCGHLRQVFFSPRNAIIIQTIA